jgi:tRNA U34 5-methylaminomethyl-2-thiouridine-forming methyltransferase MnmC
MGPKYYYIRRILHSSQKNAGFPQDLGEISAGFGRYFHRIWARFPQDLGEISAGFGRDFRRIWARFPQDLGDISAGFGRDFRRIWARFPQDLGEISAGFPPRRLHSACDTGLKIITGCRKIRASAISFGNYI